MTQALYRRIERPVLEVVPNTSIPAAALPALAHLAERMLFARARDEKPWRSAATLAELAALGLTLADCRDLIGRGLIESQTPSQSARKVAGSLRAPSAHIASPRKPRGRGEDHSSFPTGKGRPEGILRTAPRSIVKPPPLGPHCLILLTDTGLALITKHAQSSRLIEPSPSVSPSLPPSVAPSPPLPHYDIDLRELKVGGVVILRLPAQARSLAAVLTALEQSGWKPRVAKPLNGRPGGNDPHHLAIAAYKLNIRQSLIEFHADDGAFRWNWRQNVDRIVGPLACRSSDSRTQ